MSSPANVNMGAVAAKAGVARSTVSMALHDDPSIPVATRQRIRRVAEKLGYRINPLVAALMTARSTGRPVRFKAALAYVVIDSSGETWRENPVFLRFFEGAQARADELGYRLEEFPLHPAEVTPKRVAGILQARGIHGMIIAPLPHDQTSFALNIRRFAVVGIGLSVASPAIERISNDHFQSIVLAITKCRELGYRRIGFVASQETSRRLGHRWLAGYEFTASSLPGITRLEPLLPAANLDIEGALSHWCRTQRPDVVIFGVFNTRHPYRLPEKVGVVTLAVDQPGGPYAGIFQNDCLLGATAVDHLVARLHRNQFGPDTLQHIDLVEGQWVPGRSAPGLKADRKSKRP